jgi:hypothetical protein
MDDPYTPLHLQRWEDYDQEWPARYVGTQWDGWYRFFGRNRDSGPLELSNFDAALSAIGGESDGVVVTHCTHALCGWVEVIMIKADAHELLERADAIVERYHDYPVLDEPDYTEREHLQCQDFWNGSDPRSRIYILRQSSAPACLALLEYGDMLRQDTGEVYDRVRGHCLD